MPKLPASAATKKAVVAPQDPDSLRLMQAVQLVSGANPMEGIMILRELVAEDSTNVDAQFYLGAFAVQSGQMDKAVERFEKVVRLRPREVPYLSQVGYEYMRMDSTRRAMACFEQALEIDSTDNNSLFFMGQANERLGELAEAKDYYQRLLVHNTDSVVDLKVKEYITNIDKKLNP